MEIACIVADGFEDSELFEPMMALSRAGHHLTIIGTTAGAVLTGKTDGREILVEKAITEVSASDFDALLIPGGHSPDKLRANVAFIDFTKDFNRQRKLIAAICHGPQLLLTARLHRGRTMTAWPTIQGDLTQAGASVRDAEVVVDENLITSRNPADIPAFNDAIIRYLAARDSRYFKKSWATEQVGVDSTLPTS